MSHKTTSATSSPSKPPLSTPEPPKIATREYYRLSTTIDANDADIDYPADVEDELAHSSVRWQQDPFSPNEVVKSQDVYDFVEVSKAPVAPHSPTPSEIVLNSDLYDVAEMSALDREMRGRDVSSTERKKALLVLQEKLREGRQKVAAETDMVRAEMLEREYQETQRRGREEI